MAHDSSAAPVVLVVDTAPTKPARAKSSKFSSQYAQQQPALGIRIKRGELQPALTMVSTLLPSKLERDEICHWMLFLQNSLSRLEGNATTLSK